MREEHDPVVANELMEIDRALGGFGLEIRGDRAQAETRDRRVLVGLLPGCTTVVRYWGRAGGISYGSTRSVEDMLSENSIIGWNRGNL